MYPCVRLTLRLLKKSDDDNDDIDDGERDDYDAR